MDLFLSTSALLLGLLDLDAAFEREDFLPKQITPFDSNKHEELAVGFGLLLRTL